MRAALGPEVTPFAKGREISALRIADEHHGSSVTPVSAIGPAPWHVGLTPEADAAIAAGPSLDPDSRLIEKHLPREYRAFTAGR